ncbi:MAG: rhodanese-like domain-containing protein [Luteolibacter sp.]
MTHRWVMPLSSVSALALASCADTPTQSINGSYHKPPVTEERQAPLANAGDFPVKQGRVTRIALGDFFQRQQAGRALIFDVRPGFYYSLGHVPGAINWPRARFDSGLATYEPKIQSATAEGKPVFLYCTDLACPDALAVAEKLAARGHSIAVLQGGWEAWKAGELPIE